MLARQAKVLNSSQQRALLSFITTTRMADRNRVVVLLSLRAGLRAKEIAELTWAMVTDSEGRICDTINLTDQASKGRSGGTIPMARELQAALGVWQGKSRYNGSRDRVICTERSKATSNQVIVNLFFDWYRQLGFNGCSSHSGRRTFITHAARNIGRFGGSLRDVQALARHSSLAMTQRYIEQNSDAARKVVDA